jgi:hypothetical protein
MSETFEIHGVGVLAWEQEAEFESRLRASRMEGEREEGSLVIAEVIKFNILRLGVEGGGTEVLG